MLSFRNQNDCVNNYVERNKIKKKDKENVVLFRVDIQAII